MKKQATKQPARQPKKFYRSKQNRMIAGVCGGLGEYFNVDPLIVRLIMIMFTLISGAGLIIYLLAWVFVQENPNQK